MDDTARLLDATAAAARLGVKPATLYAYVSRGLLTRRRRGRGSWFDPLEVDRLAARGRSVGSAGGFCADAVDANRASSSPINSRTPVITTAALG